MWCPVCGAENRNTIRFCTKCGTYFTSRTETGERTGGIKNETAPSLNGPEDKKNGRPTDIEDRLTRTINALTEKAGGFIARKPGRLFAYSFLGLLLSLFSLLAVFIPFVGLPIATVGMLLGVITFITAAETRNNREKMPEYALVVGGVAVLLHSVDLILSTIISYTVYQMWRLFMEAMK